MNQTVTIELVFVSCSQKVPPGTLIISVISATDVYDSVVFMNKSRCIVQAAITSNNVN